MTSIRRLRNVVAAFAGTCLRVPVDYIAVR